MDEEEFEQMMEDEMDLIRDMEAQKFKKALFSENNGACKRKDSSFSSLPGLEEETDIPIHRPPAKKARRSDPEDATDSLESSGRYFNVCVDPRGRSRPYYCVRLRDEEDTPLMESKRNSSYLNGQPFTELLQEARSILKPLPSLSSSSSSSSRLDERKDASLTSSAPRRSKSQSLWVETYKPSNFLHLLSDDTINRSILQWIKLWDRVVFSRHVKPDLLDETHRPKPRLVLLHGPPGLGKTTLAHILARHAGYNPIEVNASDDRSSNEFKSKVEPAIQMQSIGNKGGKPNCVIIDEIDGVPAPTIKYLVDLASDKVKSVGSLKRPIICICNELYTPSLRLLRQIAKVVHFPPTSAHRLVERLLFITRKEKLSADAPTLKILCEKTNNDIRACLSTLQFFKARGSQKLRLMDVQNTSVGVKDMNKSNFYIWEKIFQQSRGVSKSSKNTLQGRYNFIYRTVNGHGEYDRLMNGVFENYLDMKFKDTRFENVSNANEWMIFFDMCQREIQTTQIYTLMSYSAFPFIGAHFALSSFAKTKINFPTSHRDHVAKLKKSLNLTTMCMSEMSPICRSFVTTDSLIRDVLPNLFEIMNPDLRSLNTQLYSSREKQIFKDLVSIMISYNITYVQEKSLATGEYHYRHEPALDEVAHFPGIKHSALSYSIQQVVAHEIGIEKMRRNDKRDSTGSVASAPKAPVQPPTKGEVAPKIKVRDEENRDPVDFFNRKIPKEIIEAREKDKKKNALISGVIFVFKEGYNNAVRRTVRVSDFL